MLGMIRLIVGSYSLIKFVDKKDPHHMPLSPAARNIAPKMNYKIRLNKSAENDRFLCQLESTPPVTFGTRLT